jgi:flagellar biosynthesis protein FlhG
VARFADLGLPGRRRLLAHLRAASRGHDLAILDLPAGIHPDVLHFSDPLDLALVVATPDAASLADAYAVVKLQSSRAPRSALGLVVNGASGPTQARQLTERFAAVVRRFLGATIAPFGWIPRDAAVGRAVAARRPVVLAEPSSHAAAALRALATRVREWGEGRSRVRRTAVEGVSDAPPA